MAVTPGIGSIFRYTIYMTKAAQKLQIGTLLSPSTTQTPVDYINWCTQFLNNQVTSPSSPLQQLATVCTAEVTFNGHSIQAIYPTRLVQYYAAFTPGVVTGGLGGAALPVNSAAAWERYTDDGTRAGHGSLHPPAGDVTLMVAQGSWGPTFVTTMAAVAARWTQAFVSADGTPTMFPCLWNKNAPTVIKRFIGSKINPNVRVMRRRTVGLGQ